VLPHITIEDFNYILEEVDKEVVDNFMLFVTKRRTGEEWRTQHLQLLSKYDRRPELKSALMDYYENKHLQWLLRLSKLGYFEGRKAHMVFVKQVITNK
jgi:hypothetical protein